MKTGHLGTGPVCAPGLAAQVLCSRGPTRRGQVLGVNPAVLRWPPGVVHPCQGTGPQAKCHLLAQVLCHHVRQKDANSLHIGTLEAQAQACHLCRHRTLRHVADWPRHTLSPCRVPLGVSVSIHLYPQRHAGHKVSERGRHTSDHQCVPMLAGAVALAGWVAGAQAKLLQNSWPALGSCRHSQHAAALPALCSDRCESHPGVGCDTLKGQVQARVGPGYVWGHRSARLVADPTRAALCEAEQGSRREHGQLFVVLGAAHLLLYQGNRPRPACQAHRGPSPAGPSM